MTTTPKKRRAKGRVCTIVAVDPGETTGIAVVGVSSAWLRGLGDATWGALGKAVKVRSAFQVGRHPKAFDNDADRSTRLDRSEVDEMLLPILSGQPLERADGMRSTERFYSILDGVHSAKGGDLRMNDAREIIQLRQIAGLLENYATAALVIESFELRTDVRSPEVLSPERLRLSIMQNEILHGEGRIPFFQQASYAKNTGTDERLKRAGLYFSGMQHATDAARHALTFARECRKNESVRAAAFPGFFSDNFDEMD